MYCQNLYRSRHVASLIVFLVFSEWLSTMAKICGRNIKLKFVPFNCCVLCWSLSKNCMYIQVHGEWCIYVRFYKSSNTADSPHSWVTAFCFRLFAAEYLWQSLHRTVDSSLIATCACLGAQSNIQEATCAYLSHCVAT